MLSDTELISWHTPHEAKPPNSAVLRSQIMFQTLSMWHEVRSVQIKGGDGEKIEFRDSFVSQPAGNEAWGLGPLSVVTSRKWGGRSRATLELMAERGREMKSYDFHEYMQSEPLTDDVCNAVVDRGEYTEWDEMTEKKKT